MQPTAFVYVTKEYPNILRSADVWVFFLSIGGETLSLKRKFIHFFRCPGYSYFKQSRWRRSVKSRL